MKNILQKILKILIIFTIYFGTNQALAYITVSGTINSNTVWTTGNTYYVNGTVTLSSGYTLTIQPGVIVKFAGFSSSIIANGNLQANGTNISNIVFTSKDDNTIGETISGSTGTPSAGSWRSILFDGSGANASIIDYAQIKYAGNYNYEYANIYVSASNPTIRNSSISHSSNYGVFVLSGSPTFQNNTISNNISHGLYINGGTPSIQSNSFTNNTSYGLYNSGGNASFLNNYFSGNTDIAYTFSIDPFLVSSNSSFGTNTSNKIVLTNIGNMLASSGTLKGYSNADYLISSTQTIPVGKTINIGEGAIIKFSSFSSGIIVNGVLNTSGTNSNNVIFTTINDNSVGQALGTGTPSTGSWRSILFDGSGANASIIDYAQIKYAGNYNYEYANIYISASNPTIRNSLISHSSNYGINIFSGNPSIQSNSINNNSSYGLYNYGGNASFLNNYYTGNTLTIYSYNIDPFFISTNNSFGTNTSNKIVINNLGNMTASTGTIQGYSNVDYVINSSHTIASGKTINIGPGAIIKFSGISAGIIVNGVLNTLGNSSNNVIFTSINDNSIGQALGTGTPSTGSWRSIIFDGSGANSSIIDYAQIKYAGNYNYEYANIYVSASNPTIRNSSISHSSNYGVFVLSGSPTFQNNTISNNISHGLYINGGTPSIQSNSFTNNTSYGLYNSGGNASFLNNYFSGNTDIAYTFSIDPFLISSNSSFGTNTSNKIVLTNIGNMLASSGTLKGYSNADYLISSTQTIPVGKTINIGEGAIIKFSSFSSGIIVNGVFNTSGTTSNNVIFTTINDNSVGQTLGNGTPTTGSWRSILFDGSGANASIIDYTQIKYAGNYNYEYANIYVSASNPTIRNSLISHSSNYGVFVLSGSPTFQNNILYNNTSYGFYKNGGTPSYTYNLFYNSSSTTLNSNVSIDTNPAVGGNIINTNPLFVSPSTGNFRLQVSSPAINLGNPSLGNHIFSGDRYDIGSYEYSGYANLPFSANITGVSSRNLTYTWSIIQDPTNGSNPPTITGPSGSISADGSVACSFQVTKLGSYSLKLEIKEGANVIGTSTNNFTVTGP